MHHMSVGLRYTLRLALWFIRSTYSIVQPKEKGLSLRSTAPTARLTNESRNVMRSAPFVTTAAFPESRTSVYTKTRRKNQRTRANISNVAKYFQWILLLPLKSALPPSLRITCPRNSLVCFPLIYRSYTHWLRRSWNGVMCLLTPSSMLCQTYPLTTSA